MQAKKLVRALAKVACLYGFATWAWVAISVLDPVTAPWQVAPLSQYIGLPTDLVGIVGFVVSGFSALVWECLKE